MADKPRLFHVAVPGFVHSRTFRCIWLFEELEDVDFEICMLHPRDPYGPQMREFGVLHSHKIPTLQMDGQEICESGVISQIVAERFGSGQGLMGEDDERIELLQWIAMAETCITFRIPLMPTLMGKDTELADLRERAIKPMRKVFEANIDRFEGHFEAQKSEYLLKSGFSIADTMCGWSLHTFHGWGDHGPGYREIAIDPVLSRTPSRSPCVSKRRGLRKRGARPLSKRLCPTGVRPSQIF